MSVRTFRAEAALLATAVTIGCHTGQSDRILRVCADPNNLPFSNEKREGFENRLAELLAKDLGARVTYTWRAQRRGFLRTTLRAGQCDLVMGFPAAGEMALPGKPYYRSTYVFLTRVDRRLAIHSLDDPILRSLRIGIHMIGDDYANVPPAAALARRGIVANVVGYTIYGDYSRPDPPSRLVKAVADGEVDVAIVWGPIAGYFAPKQKVPLEMEPVTPAVDPPFFPMVFDIAMAVRRPDTLFLHQVDEVVARHQREVDQILDEYGVPRVEGAP
jgi:mxaJ protein